ncbi:MAG: hypothetical protein ABEH66_02895 [Halobacteriales archaeon]
MGSGTVTCPRCDREVDELQFLPPDFLTREIIDAVESDEQHFADGDGMEVCDGCVAELDGE